MAKVIVHVKKDKHWKSFLAGAMSMRRRILAATTDEGFAAIVKAIPPIPRKKKG